MSTNGDTLNDKNRNLENLRKDMTMMSAENLKRGPFSSQLLLPSLILLLALAATPSGAQDSGRVDNQVRSVFNPFTLQRVDTSSQPVSPRPLAFDGTELPALRLVKPAAAQAARPSTATRNFKIRMPLISSNPHFRSPYRIPGSD